MGGGAGGFRPTKKETKARQQLQDTGITFSEENLV